MAFLLRRDPLLLAAAARLFDAYCVSSWADAIRPDRQSYPCQTGPTQALPDLWSFGCDQLPHTLSYGVEPPDDYLPTVSREKAPDRANPSAIASKTYDARGKPPAGETLKFCGETADEHTSATTERTHDRVAATRSANPVRRALMNADTRH